MDPDSKKPISDSERSAVYADIHNAFAYDKPSLTFPRLILVGGQPGAGKSFVARQAINELKAIGAPVETDIDDIRTFYPDAQGIFEQSPFEMSLITNKESWGWTSHLLLDARHAKNNVVYQATIRNAQRIEDLIRDFQQDGFAVDMYAVATHSRYSAQGVFRRFEDGIRNMDEGVAVIPRWIPLPFHNLVYRDFPNSIEYLAANAGLERVGVFRRDGTRLYLSDGQLIHRGAKDALMAEHRRPWSKPERAHFNEVWKDLLQRIEARSEGKLKPKWYMMAARLYAVEAKYLEEASSVLNKIAPANASVEARTPHHVFVRSEDGKLTAYLRKSDVSIIKPARKAPSRRPDGPG